MRAWVLLLVAAALLLAFPDLAEACAVCSTGRDDEARSAFIWTTVFMSLTPLLLVGAAVLWLRGRLREQEARIADRRAQAGGSSPAPVGGASPAPVAFR